MSTKTEGDDFDPYEENYVYSNLNPIIIKGYVRDFSPSALIWKNYGLHEQGAKELICDKRFETALKNANKIEIDGVAYQVYKEAIGNRTLITKRPFGIIRVVLSRKG
jgi:hypothetical protein